MKSPTRSRKDPAQVNVTQEEEHGGVENHPKRITKLVQKLRNIKL